jgi:REP element-mobilizing transposase RayT
MARPLRIQYPGAYYHVMNRGNRREDIFVDDTDRSRFVDALVDSCETFSVKLIAYVLMNNHFHLLIQNTQANLSEFMRQSSNADTQSKSDYLKKYSWSTYPGYCYLRKRDKNI